MDIEGKVGRLGRVSGNQPIRLTEFGDVAVSQILPPYAQLAAAGKLFAFNTFAGTAKAPVVAPPTTSPEWALYNANPGGGASLVVLQVGVGLVSGTAGLGLSIVGAAALGPQTAVTANYASAVVSCLDGSRRTPNAFITNNPTLVGGTPAWFLLAATGVNTVAVDAVFEGLVADVHGMLIAPPNGGMVAFEIVGETGASALYAISVIFAELDIVLG